MMARVASRSLLLLIALSIGRTGYAAPAVRITVETTPPGAKVYVDSQATGMVCQSGPDCKPRLSLGTHRIILELEGYKPLQETINVTAAQRYAFVLQPLPARIEIQVAAAGSAGSGGEILLDGQPAGSVPATLEVTPGKHTIEVRRTGFLPFTEAVEIKSGETRVLVAALNAIPPPPATTGSIQILAEKEGSEVFVDDDYRGIAPLTVENLTPGEHVIEIQPKVRDLQVFRTTVRISAGEQSVTYGMFQPRQRPAATPPPPPVPPLVTCPPLHPVTVVAPDGKTPYTVAMSTGHVCTTPCRLNLPAEAISVRVAAPGYRMFETSLSIPPGGVQLVVQRYTLNRLLIGTILSSLGLPLFIGGSYLTQVSRVSRNDAGVGAGVLLLLHGFAFSIAGITELSRIETNSIKMRGLNARVAANRAKPRLLAAAAAPTEDRGGAAASFLFSY